MLEFLRSRPVLVYDGEEDDAAAGVCGPSALTAAVAFVVQPRGSSLGSRFNVERFTQKPSSEMPASTGKDFFWLCATMRRIHVSSTFETPEMTSRSSSAAT